MLLSHEARYIKSNIKTVCTLKVKGQQYRAWSTEMKVFFTTLRYSKVERFLNPPTETFPRERGELECSYEWEYQVSLSSS